jgi:signal transduction histidine kinase
LTVALSASIVDQLRGICNSVRPSVLDELGLAAALQVLAHELCTHSGVQVRADTDPELQELSLPPPIELILYRAAQEAVNNSLHYARPTYVGISLVRIGEQVRLRVTDNGSGFAVPTSLDSYAATNHLGLAGLSNRVRRAGGTLHVRSAPGQGTVVEVRIEGSTDEEPA